MTCDRNSALCRSNSACTAVPLSTGSSTDDTGMKGFAQMVVFPGDTWISFVGVTRAQLHTTQQLLHQSAEVLLHSQRAKFGLWDGRVEVVSTQFPQISTHGKITTAGHQTTPSLGACATRVEVNSCADFCAVRKQPRWRYTSAKFLQGHGKASSSNRSEIQKRSAASFHKQQLHGIKHTTHQSTVTSVQYSYCTDCRGRIADFEIQNFPMDHDFRQSCPVSQQPINRLI